MPTHLTGQPDPILARPLARFELLLAAVVGFTWGPLLFHFVRHLSAWDTTLAVCAAAVALGFLGASAPTSYYRLRAWERAGRGRVYERLFRIREFKRWMSNGDWMNAWLRRRVPGYRLVAPTRASAAAYAERARGIERAHLAWLFGALAPTAYALLVGAHAAAALWALANLVTNAWPILLQRYNRVRAEEVSLRRGAASQS